MTIMSNGIEEKVEKPPAEEESVANIIERFNQGNWPKCFARRDWAEDKLGVRF